MDTLKRYLGPYAYLILGVGLLFIVVNAAIFFFHIRKGPPHDWATHIFAGKVVALQTGVFTVRDAHNTVRSFVLTPHTKIVSGRTTVGLDLLATGTVVLVTPAPFHGGPEEAAEVRVLNTGDNAQ